MKLHPLFNDVHNSLAELGIDPKAEENPFLPPMMHALLVLDCAWGAEDHAAVVDMAVTAELIHRVSVWHSGVEETTGQGTGRTILTGDLALARAFELLARHHRHRGLPLMAGAIEAIAEGNIRELAARFSLNESVADYIARRGKTVAYLTAASCRLGGQVAGRNQTVLKGLWKAGYTLGLGLASAADVGSWMVGNLLKTMHPLLRGFLGLPEVYLLGQAEHREFALLLAKRDVKPGDLTSVQRSLDETGALEQARGFAARHLAQARELLRGLSTPSPCAIEPPIPGRIREIICEH